MISIFSELLESCVEVFMDDFTMYGHSFMACLESLSIVLDRYIETNLVLNFEKCHFMVTKGIVLGYLMSNRGIEVDKAKIDIISSLSHRASVQEVHSFLGHVGYASHTLDSTQANYTTTEKELLGIVFALDKFCTYFLDSKIVIFFDHATLKFLLKKPDAKPRLIR
ncbi:Retrovirus-related Pol polyprotein from transposon opus, partial [Mucuna pruriens]